MTGDSNRSRNESLALAVIVPFFLCAGLYLVLQVARDYALARSGVETTCRVVSSEVERYDPDDGRTSYTAEVVFVHEVGGERYRVADESPGSLDQLVAQRTVQAFPPGSVVRCHRLSWFPRFATVFERNVSGFGFWAPGVFGVVLMFIPVVVFAVDGRKRRRGRR